MAHIAVWVMGGTRPIHLTGVRWPTLLTEGDIWLVQTDGTGAHKLGSAGAKAESPAWSPDGGVIRFSSRQSALGDIVERIGSSSVAPRLAHLGHYMLRPLDP